MAANLCTRLGGTKTFASVTTTIFFDATPPFFVTNFFRGVGPSICWVRSKKKKKKKVFFLKTRPLLGGKKKKGHLFTDADRFGGKTRNKGAHVLSRGVRPPLLRVRPPPLGGSDP